MGMISDLYKGDILEFECAGYADSDEYRGLVDNVAHAEQLLLQQLTDEEKALYQVIHDDRVAMMMLEQEYTFVTGFRLGALLMADIYNEE